MSKQKIARTKTTTKQAAESTRDADMLGLVELTEQRITDAIDSLGLGEPEAAALASSKALSSVRALSGELERPEVAS